MSPSPTRENGEMGDHLVRGITERPRWRRALTDLVTYRTTLIVILAPLIASPLIFTGQSELRCLFVVIVMGVYWMFEVMPLAATALMPTFLFPLLGVMSTKDICVNYLTHINFLFIGGLIVALAVEKSNLHQRVALRVLTVVGAQPKWVMLGFMGTTAFLSMWMSNTATSAMMVPIAQSVIQELLAHRKHNADDGGARRSRHGSPLARKHMKKGISEDGPADDEEICLSVVREEIESADAHYQHHPRAVIDGVTGDDLPLKRQRSVEIEKVIEQAKRERRASRRRSSLLEVSPVEQPPTQLNLSTMSKEDGNIAKALIMSIAFAANIGGTGTITGTPPNLVLVQEFDKKYGDHGARGLISFLVWMEFSIPLMIVAVFVSWLCLVVYFMGMSQITSLFRRGGDKRDKSGTAAMELMFRAKFNALPRMSFAEWQVIVCFSMLLSMWIFRDPKVIAGFGGWFEPKFYTDATSAMIISVLLFLLPDQLPHFTFIHGERRGPRAVSRGSLMDWPTMQHKFPWSVVLLLGGGFALAAGVERSGLSAAVGEILRGLSGLDRVWLQLICVVVTVFVTNICSNTVTAVIFLQIVAEMAVKLHYNPLVFMLPTVLACSYAFILPVATPPNAIVFSTGLLTVNDMMGAGAVVSVVTVGLIMLHMTLWAPLVFGINTFPEWAMLAANATNAL